MPFDVRAKAWMRVYVEGDSGRLGFGRPLRERQHPRSGKLLVNAEVAAFKREAQLRRVYAKNMPPCRIFVTVDPDGLVIGSRKRLAVTNPEASGVVLTEPVR